MRTKVRLNHCGLPGSISSRKIFAMSNQRKALTRRRFGRRGSCSIRGKIKIDGHADFLAEPHVTLKGGLQLQQITLDYFKRITERYQLSVQQGVLSSDAMIEYARESTNIQIKQLTLD